LDRRNRPAAGLSGPGPLLTTVLVAVATPRQPRAPDRRHRTEAGQQIRRQLIQPDKLSLRPGPGLRSAAASNRLDQGETHTALLQASEGRDRGASWAGHHVLSWPGCKLLLLQQLHRPAIISAGELQRTVRAAGRAATAAIRPTLRSPPRASAGPEEARARKPSSWLSGSSNNLAADAKPRRT